ncbi:MAG: hypothetical protein GDA52_10915 [Rhodobacteraceae bacterium]|nr:hypothetical protein [Paracoccaceae bacterium]
MDTPTEEDEKRLTRELRAMADQAQADVRYNPTRFRQMLAEHGGFGTARLLLADAKLSEGFTELLLRGRVDLTLECLVQRPGWSRFFSEEELRVARQRTDDRC